MASRKAPLTENPLDLQLDPQMNLDFFDVGTHLGSSVGYYKLYRYGNIDGSLDGLSLVLEDGTVLGYLYGAIDIFKLCIDEGMDMGYLFE